MIPRVEIELWVNDPMLASGLPDRDEAAHAGFADGNWQYEASLLQATWQDALDALEVEQNRVALADAGSTSAAEFEAIVDGDLEDWEIEPLWGLDVGVAAAVLSLIAAGCVTTTSCRGHVGRFAGNSREVARVRFMSDPARALLVRDAAVAACCGFGVEPPMVEVFAPSVIETLEFARQMLGRRDAFDLYERVAYDLPDDEDY